MSSFQMSIKSICCLGAGYVGGPTCCIIGNHDYHLFAICFIIITAITIINILPNCCCNDNNSLPQLSSALISRWLLWTSPMRGAPCQNHVDLSCLNFSILVICFHHNTSDPGWQLGTLTTFQSMNLVWTRLSRRWVNFVSYIPHNWLHLPPTIHNNQTYKHITLAMSSKSHIASILILIINHLNHHYPHQWRAILFILCTLLRCEEEIYTFQQTSKARSRRLT